MNPTIGKNITTVPTSDIQKNLGGGLVVDNKYGPKTTASVVAFQTANGLKPDGIFGPLTQAAYDKKFNSSIISTGDVHDKAKNDSSDLDTALKMFNVNYSNPDKKNSSGNVPNKVEKDPIIDDTVTGSDQDPYIKALDAMAARSNDSTKMLVQNIKAIKDRQRGSVDKQYNDYKSGLQLLGIQTNAAQVTPDLLMSHINQAESEHMDKINKLDSEEVTALMDAENARADNDFKVLGEKMDYVKQIRKEKSDALKEYQKSISTDIVESAKIAKTVGHDIYETLLTLNDEDKESFLVAVAKKFNLPLGSLVTALSDEQTTRKKDENKDDSEKVLSPTEAATLGVPYGTTQGEATKMGITPDRYKPTTDKGPSDTQLEKDEIKQGKDILKTGIMPDGTKIGNPQGSDGFYDPGVYTTLFNSWQGTPKDFVSKYPIVGSVNPLSYAKLPEALRKLLPASATKKEKAPLF